MVVDDSGVKYSVKEHALHPTVSLEDKYKVTTDWEGKLHIGISLQWDYEKFTVQISMPGYVCASINSFQKERNDHKSYHTPGTNISMEIITRF